MKILVTGANGFIGKNLFSNLLNIRDNYNRTRPNIELEEVNSISHTDSDEKLRKYCSDCDILIHLAGVNRPENEGEYNEGNTKFTEKIISYLKETGNTPQIIFSSSIQATLLGKYEGSVYGKSKRDCEEVLKQFSIDTGAKIFIYRFPNVYGKWCRPNYNSVVATFCYAIANNLPLTIDKNNAKLELLYIDDLMEEIYDCIEGHPHRCSYMGMDLIPDAHGEFCFVPKTSRASLKYIVKLLQSYSKLSETLSIFSVDDDGFSKKLYATYLSYLPSDKFQYSLKMNVNDTGSFTELIRTTGESQFAVNITNSSSMRGQHWHNTKWEIFVVVSGHGLIQQRNYNSGEIFNYEVSGEKLEAIIIPPGYVHNLINVSDHEDLITLIWANEQFDPDKPDTYREKV